MQLATLSQSLFCWVAFQAAEIDAAVSRGESLGPLAGVAVAIKVRGPAQCILAMLNILKATSSNVSCQHQTAACTGVFGC